MPGTSTDSSLTPYRATRVRFQVDDASILEPDFVVTRAGYEITRGGLGPGNSSGIMRLASGALSLEPLQQDPSKLHQLTDTQSAILKDTDFNLQPTIGSANTWRAGTDLPGVSY